MKIISFSLYGDNPVYTIGVFKNALLRRIFYSDWTMRVYYNSTVPQDIIIKLAETDIQLVNTNEDKGYINSLWRFRPAEEDIEYFISRDADSRISERDIAATSEWILSDKSFHIIRDHPIGHGWLMNAGMWGCKGRAIPNLSELINSYMASHDRSNRTIDQCFLRDIIYPIAKTDLFLHKQSLHQ